MPSNGIVPVDYGTPVGQVRLLIPDVATDDGTNNTDYLISDGAIQGALSLYASSVRRAAAALIDAIANDEALTYKITKTDDLSINGTAVAEALRRRAESLRSEADQFEDVPDGFQMVYPYPEETWVVPETTTVPWPVRFQWR
jgi:hypothetical protein